MALISVSGSFAFDGIHDTEGNAEEEKGPAGGTNIRSGASRSRRLLSAHNSVGCWPGAKLYGCCRSKNLRLADTRPRVAISTMTPCCAA